jgi:hypothetical protein
VRVNYRGTDIVNAPVSFFNLMNNMHWGVAEASSTVSAAFAFSIYVPFHVPWEQTNGLVSRKEDKGFFELTFPLLTSAVIDSGTVEVYYIVARGVASYVPLWIQQNIQVGGASVATDKIQQYNISSLYIVENAHITGQVLVFRDGMSVINASQAVLKAKSNFDNRIETAIALIQVDLNPNNILSNALSQQIELNAGMDAATAIELYYLALLFQSQTVLPTGTGTKLVTTPQTKTTEQLRAEGKALGYTF